jgi:pilus assembly protein Flp/PilA
MIFVKTLWNDQSGASAAEYALILAIVGTGIAVAAFNLGGSIKGAMDQSSTCISNAVVGTGVLAKCQ